MLAATSPTYTPLPLWGLHSALRMVVADLSQTFSPPRDPACGDQWRGPDYVPSPIAGTPGGTERGAAGGN